MHQSCEIATMALLGLHKTMVVQASDKAPTDSAQTRSVRTNLIFGLIFAIDVSIDVSLQHTK